MASSSAGNQSPKGKKEVVPSYLPYPPPLARYEDAVISPRLFMDTLEKLHATMETKFMIPIIGGKDLDLHRLFVEVTSRGGFAKIIRERRWKEVTAVFSFPPTATNASFVLRKYYGSLLYHYEQIYFFKAKGWIPSTEPSQSLSSPPVPPQDLAKPVQPSPELQATAVKRQRPNAAEFLPGVSAATSAPSTSSTVVGVIDGKFEGGYLVTVTHGPETLKGVLYLTPQNPALQLSQHRTLPSCTSENTSAAPVMHRRKRRKKSEMKKRDPNHPKPNRSGYNFFFAEQHARLKPLYPGKDREISRMIGELWTKMQEPEKGVYQEKAVEDKERYRTEMEDYRERLRTGQIISNAMPIQQLPLEPGVNMVETNEKNEIGGEELPQTPENYISSGKSGSSDSEDKTADKDSEMETSPAAEVGPENIGLEDSVDEPGIEFLKVGDDRVKGMEPVEEKGFMPCEGKPPAVELGPENIGLENSVDEAGIELLKVGDNSVKELEPVEEKGLMLCEGTESLPSEQVHSVSGAKA